jgi:hypothetical protein
MTVRAIAAAFAALAACAPAADDSRQAARASADTAAQRALADRCTRGAPRLTPGGVGAVRLGARLADVAAACTVRDTAIELEGVPERAHVVEVGTGRVVAITTGTRDTSVARVVVADPVYRTDNGAGVGQTLGALRRAHGRICALAGEGRMVVLAASLPGVSFGTSTPVDLAATRDPTLLPDSVRIEAAWITEDSAPCGGP